MTATATLTTYKMYIDGQWVDAASSDHFESEVFREAIAIGNDVVYGLAAGVWISTATTVPNPFIQR